MAQTLKMVTYAEQKGIKPCACGNADLVVWEPSPRDITNLEKIECNRCGATVWGSGDDEIAQWNAGEYDEPGATKA